MNRNIPLPHFHFSLQEVHQSNEGWSPVYLEDNLAVMSIGVRAERWVEQLKGRQSMILGRAIINSSVIMLRFHATQS